MFNPIEHPLDTYVNHYLGVRRFKQERLIAVMITLLAGAVIGYLAYLTLTKGLLPLSLGQGGNIAAAVITGAGISTLALASIAIHYCVKIVEKYENSREEIFLQALMHDQTADLFLKKDGVNKMTALRFRFLLERDFPDENWKGMMHYMDHHFFRTPGVQYEEKRIYQAYATFFAADGFRFLELYREMKAELSIPCQKFLDTNFQVVLNQLNQKKLLHFLNRGQNVQQFLASPEECFWLFEKIKGFNDEGWKQVILLFNHSPQEAAFQLLEQLAEYDPKKFFHSYMNIIASCKSKIREQIEERCLFREKTMKANWSDLYHLNQTLFIVKYFELKSQGNWIDEDTYLQQIEPLLKAQKFQDWLQLMKAIDILYFRTGSNAPHKTALLITLQDLDEKKFEEAFLAGYFEFSKTFVKQFKKN